MIGLLLSAIFYIIILALLYWATTFLPLPAPAPAFIKVLFIIILILILLGLLTGQVPVYHTTVIR